MPIIETVTLQKEPYFEKRAFYEAVSVGLLLGLALVVSGAIDHPLLQWAPFAPIIALLVWKRDWFKGFQRQRMFYVGTSGSFRNLVFTLIYFILAMSTVLFVINVNKYLWQPNF